MKSDEPVVYVGKNKYKFGRLVLSHMASPDINALHTMAELIGMQRKWFQNKPGRPHYDISQIKKRKAIELGAVEVSDKILIKECFLKSSE